MHYKYRKRKNIIVVDSVVSMQEALDKAGLDIQEQKLLNGIYRITVDLNRFKFPEIVEQRLKEALNSI